MPAHRELVDSKPICAGMGHPVFAQRAAGDEPREIARFEHLADAIVAIDALGVVGHYLRIELRSDEHGDATFYTWPTPEGQKRRQVTGR